MPRFRYTATNEKGKTVRGLLEAPSEEALYAKLRNDGLYMTDAQEAQKALATFRPLKTAVLADFCRNLGTLLTAGVPLVRAFRIMADERTNGIPLVLETPDETLWPDEIAMLKGFAEAE